MSLSLPFSSSLSFSLSTSLYICVRFILNTVSSSHQFVTLPRDPLVFLGWDFLYSLTTLLLYLSFVLSLSHSACLAILCHSELRCVSTSLPPCLRWIRRCLHWSTSFSLTAAGVVSLSALTGFHSPSSFAHFFRSPSCPMRCVCLAPILLTTFLTSFRAANFNNHNSTLFQRFLITLNFSYWIHLTLFLWLWLWHTPRLCVSIGMFSLELPFIFYNQQLLLSFHQN